MLIARLVILLVLLLLIPSVYAKALVPAPLQPWTSWVLDRVENLDCTPLYHSAERKVCTWVGAASLNIDVQRLRFQFSVRMLEEGWQSLPGTDELWPQEVRVGGNRAPVVSRQGVPYVRLDSGTHTIKGVIRWSALPQSIRLPLSFAMIDLKPDKELEGRVYIDERNRLWLVREQVRTEPQTENLTARVYRKLVDSEPKNMEVVIQLEVSGSEREVMLQTLQLPGWTLVDFQSPLPARIEDSGALRMQVRPGIWQVKSSFRQHNRLNVFRPRIDAASGWPTQEIWVVQSRPDLRRIAIEGEAVDPQQTTLPEAWKSLPAYRLGDGDRLYLRELSRGQQQTGENRLRQDSEIWLSFAADRWFWRDSLQGQISRDWRLEQAAPFVLGHTKVDGKPQLITQLSGAGLRGAEVRHQQTTLEAVSTMPVIKNGWSITLPASGWLESGDFEYINTRANLPPGWWPVAVTGADRSQGSWLDQWTLWDVFLWLLIVAAFWRMEGWLAGGAAAIGLAFAYHEISSPVVVWLAVLIPLALLRVVDHPLWRGVLNIWRWGAFLAVVALLLNYSVSQLRMSIYPQLEMVGQVEQEYEPAHEPLYEGSVAESNELSSARQLYQAPMAPAKMEKRDMSQSLLDEPWQTGPGIPDWRWRTISLSWNGGMTEGQAAKLMVLTPAQTRLVRVIHVGLLVGLVVVLLGHRRRPSDLQPEPPSTPSEGAGSVPILLVCALLFLPLFSQEAMANNFPSPELLGELQSRLTQAPECMPDCADLNSVELVLDGYSLTVSMELSALEEVVIPVPAKAGYWVPKRVFLDGREVKFATALSAAKGEGAVGNWMVSVEAGVHELVLEGSVREKDQFKLFFPLQPQRFTSQVTDWVMSGANEQGMQGSELGFERTSVSQRRAESRHSLFQESAPAFVRVERIIELGLRWRVRTRVSRIAPLRGAVSLAVPLLPGESVVKGAASAKDGYAHFTLPDLSSQIEWESTLSGVDRIDLMAPVSVPWSEHWEVSVSPHWRLNFSGLAPYQIVSRGVWQPRWQPRPGESVLLEVSQPVPVSGQLLTVDRVDLHQDIRSKSKRVDLSIQLRSSKSQRFRFDLPSGAELQSVILSGEDIPRGNNSGEVDVVLGYGHETLQVVWTMPLGESGWEYSTPELQLPVASSNINLTTVLPGAVWPVWTGGPALGPAVLFWGVLFVTLAVAWFLGGHQGNPLGRVSWVILALGATLGWVQGLLILVVWFYSLQYRKGLTMSRGKWLRRGYQVWLVLLTLLTIGWVVSSIPQGLIGRPMDYVAGNGSSMNVMRWYADVAEGGLPDARVIVVPVMLYRLAILLWALWLAFAMLNWLQWGWQKFSESLEVGDGVGTKEVSLSSPELEKDSNKDVFGGGGPSSTDPESAQSEATGAESPDPDKPLNKPGSDNDG